MDISAFHQLSFWDSLIISTAEAARCETLLTEDMNDGQIIEGVRIVNPLVAPQVRDRLTAIRQ